MTARALPHDSGTGGAAVFELERFEWTAPDRIEVAGRWSGLRARRFIRPTLTLDGPEGPIRLLALLEHKPWDPAEGAEWIAAFAWSGEVVEVDAAELSLSGGIELALPKPRPLPGAGRRPRWRAPKRIVSAAAARPAVELREDAAVFADPPEPVETPARAPEPEPEPEEPTGDAAAMLRLPAREDTEAITAAMAERDGAVAEREAAVREREAALRERDAALGARDAAVAAAAETDAALRRLESEREAAREAQKTAIRERVDAQRDRDSAVAERDEAIERLKDATTAQGAAVADRDAAFRERDRAAAERDAARRERDEAVEALEQTLSERASARRAREMAELAGPGRVPTVAEPPREQWVSRVVALGILAAFALVVVLLFHGSF